MRQPDRPRITPTTWFVVTAVLGFPIGAAAVALAATRLASLQYRTMPVLAANHLVTLGWGTMVAFGSLNQLLPAAAGVRASPDRFVRAQFALYVLGLLSLIAGFLIDIPALLIGGGSAVVVSAMLFLTSAATVLWRRTRWIPVLSFVVAALVCLAAVFVWGLLFVLNWRFQFWRFLLTPEGLVVHLVLGLVGWFTLLIVGVSYYLLPRFSGASVPARPRVVLWGLVSGIGLVITGSFTAHVVVRAGWLVIAAAGLVYTRDLATQLRAWHPRARDISRVHWQLLAWETATLSLGIAASAVGILPGDVRRWGVAGVSLFLLGWVTPAITGQAYKVTPFLMWYYRFGVGIPAIEVPRLEAPYWPPHGPVTLLLLSGGAFLISLGVLLGNPRVSVAGGPAFFAGACMFSYVLGYSWVGKQMRRSA
jgi:hypothetical protein